MIMIDEKIERYYSLGQEQQRLCGRGEVERLRTQSILERRLPAAPAVICDIGGGAGIHSFWLAANGHSVHLTDPIPLHIDQARSYSVQSGIPLASVAVGDARQLDFVAEFADAVLLLGPLYHLVHRSERLAALSEAHRVLKRGGVLFAAAISRFASFIDGLSSGYFGDPEFRSIVRADLKSGEHRNPTDRPDYFTTGYFHRPEELADEIQVSGFSSVNLLSVEGPAWGAAHFREAAAKPDQRHDLLEFLLEIEMEPSIVGASNHVMAVGRKVA